MRGSWRRFGRYVQSASANAPAKHSRHRLLPMPPLTARSRPQPSTSSASRARRFLISWAISSSVRAPATAASKSAGAAAAAADQATGWSALSAALIGGHSRVAEALIDAGEEGPAIATGEELLKEMDEGEQLIAADCLRRGTGQEQAAHVVSTQP